MRAMQALCHFATRPISIINRLCFHCAAFENFRRRTKGWKWEKSGRNGVVQSMGARAMIEMSTEAVFVCLFVARDTFCFFFQLSSSATFGRFYLVGCSAVSQYCWHIFVFALVVLRLEDDETTRRTLDWWHLHVINAAVLEAKSSANCNRCQQCTKRLHRVCSQRFFLFINNSFSAHLSQNALPLAMWQDTLNVCFSLYFVPS